MSMHSKFYKSIASYYASIQEQYSVKYLRETFIATFIVVLLGAGYFLHKFYVQYREERAFVALSEVVDSFTKSQRETQALDNEKDKEKIMQSWQDTEILLDALYKEHNNSYLAPYFLVFKSQIALERDQDLDKAIALMDDALHGISRKTELGSLYHIKRIKMGFDSKHPEVQEKSLHDLIEISKDSQDPAYEEALYLLGVYYISINDSQKSQEAFERLISSSDAVALLKSPWVKLAQEKLGLVSKVLAE